MVQQWELLLVTDAVMLRAGHHIGTRSTQEDARKKKREAAERTESIVDGRSSRPVAETG